MNPKLIMNMGQHMGDVYAAVTDRILVNLAKHFQYIKDGTEPAGAWQYQVKKLAEMGQVTKETEQIILSMLGDADEALQNVLEQAIIDGLKDVEPNLREAAKRGLLGTPTVPEIAPNQTQAFQAYYRQSADKLNLVNTTMLRSTQQAYQSTVADIAAKIGTTQTILDTATGEVVTGVTSFNAAVRSAVKKMVDNGLTGFVDKSGRHWSPEAYVNMDVRTTMAQTSRWAVFERMNDYYSDLYQVSYHDGARPLCYPWQGKVISRGNWSRDVVDGDGNTVHVYAQSDTTYGEPAGLFGINCGHYPIPFVPGFSSIRPPKQDAEENAKEYEESQQQRALERKLREEKRDLAVLKAQGADKAEIDAQKAKVTKARDNLDDFCDRTGRERRKSREYVPIKPEWPDTGNVASQATREPKKSDLIKLFELNNVEAVAVKPLPEPLTSEQIIKKISGADKTKGSCASVGLAYVGNKAGFDVTDYRGGISQAVVSRNSTLQKIATIPGVDGIIVKGENDFNIAHELLSNVKEGKEYYFTAGKHAAIVRKVETGYEYLEMQSGYRENTWYQLTDYELRKRFGCQRSHTAYGQKLSVSDSIFDIDKVKGNKQFEEVLQFINTAVDKQMKGVGGGEK